MKKKLIIKLIIFIILMCFIVFKYVVLLNYKTENIPIDNDSIFNETINIKYKESNNQTSFENMTYNNYFSDYVTKENTNFKVKYNSDNKVESFYNISKEKQYIYILNNNSLSLFADKEVSSFETEKYMKDYLNKNNIKNDIDLLKHIKEKYYIKSYIYTPIKTMKSNYIINSFVQIALPEFKNIILVKGDNTNGYIINTKSVSEIHLLHDENQYIITLSGNEITNKEFINNLLETISFN